MNRLIIRLYEASIENDDGLVPEEAKVDPALAGELSSEKRTFGVLSSFCDWAIADEKGELLEFHQADDINQLIESLATQGVKYSDIVVCPPMEKLHVRRISLAAGQHKHLDKIVPFLMEEDLSQSTEELHFTILTKGQKDNAWVAVVEAQLMSIWIDQLDEWRITTPIMLPLSCAFMENNQELPTLISINSRDMKEGYPWLWIADDSSHCLPESMLAHLPKQEMSVYSSVSQEAPLALSFDNEMLHTKTYGLTAEVYALENVANYIGKNKTWREKNLCHGDFRQGGIWLEKLSAWRWVAAFAVIAFFLELFLMQASTKVLLEQEVSVREKSNRLFLELVPSEGRVVNLSRQLKGLLQQNPLSKNAQQTDVVYDVLAKIDQTRAQVKGNHRLAKLDYFDQTYRLDWTAENRDTLDEIREVLSNKWPNKSLTVLLEQVVRQEKGYRAALKIQTEG